MIIKSISNKSSNPGILIRYVLRYISQPDKNDSLTRDFPDIAQSDLTILHNIRNTSIEQIIEEFKRHESFRLHKRHDNVRLLHTVISASKFDRQVTDYRILKDIAQKYISLRGEDNLYIGCPHFDKDHAHIHIVSPGILTNGLSASISKEKFKAIKNALTEYQKEQYPALIHSLPNHQKGDKLDPESIIERIKASKQSHKQFLLQSISSNYASARSTEEFLSNLKALGCEPYFRNGKLKGLQYQERRYRLHRLGMAENIMQVLEQECKQRNMLSAFQFQRTGNLENRHIEQPSENEAKLNKIMDTEKNELEELASIRNASKDNEREYDAQEDLIPTFESMRRMSSKLLFGSNYSNLD